VGANSSQFEIVRPSPAVQLRREGLPERAKKKKMITKIGRTGGNSPSMQTTIPKDILEILGWEAGDRVIWTLVEDGVHLGKFLKTKKHG